MALGSKHLQMMLTGRLPACYARGVSVEHPDIPGLSTGVGGSPASALPFTPAVERCVGCGLPLTRRGAGGECLRCALRLVLDADEAEEVSADDVAIASKGRRYGHFEVTPGADGLPDELGSGAMGTTYRAQDTVLRSAVALKVISQNVANNPAARARFLREARATARLHHPNVASVTFYGEQAGDCFYAMELVEGETLEARVRRAGVLAPREVMEIGVQVARALAAAEGCGVVHRDLKPSNLMLMSTPVAALGGEAAPSLHVKVIDWGLAKAASAEDELLGADHTRDAFVGTPAFASPEQFTRTGERRIDTRSDIYSLGVTLWYLLCGRAPFVGDTLEAIHARQRELPMEQLKAAKVPGCLAGAIRRMVAFDPADRPQSARELLDVLRRGQEKHATHAMAATHRGRHRRLAGALTACAALLVAAGAWRWHAGTPPVAAAAVKPSLAVLPFENLGPGQDEGFFTLGMQKEITNDLGRVSRMTALNPESAQAYQPGQPRDFAAIGRALGASFLLEGSVQRTNGRVKVVTRLIDTKHPAAAVWVKRYEGSLREVFDLQSAVTLDTVNRLHVALTPREKLDVSRPSTTDPEAHDLFLRAEALDLLEDTGETGEVQRHYKQVELLDAAVARDPNDVLAYCDLHDAHLWLYNARALDPAEIQAIDHRSLGEVALAKARRLQPDGGEVHLATANSLYLASHDNEQARIEVDLARQRLPNSRDVEYITGEIAFGQGHWQEAMRCFERACALDPLNWRLRFDVADYYRHLRRYEDYDRIMARGIALMPAKDSGDYQAMRQIGMFEIRSDPSAYRSALETMSDADGPGGRNRSLYNFLGSILARQADAAASALGGFDDRPSREGTHLYPRAWYEAQLAHLRGDEAGVKAAFMAARPWVEKQVAANPDDGWLLSMLAVFDAGLGNRDEAVAEGLKAVSLTPYGRDLDYASNVRGNLAMVYAWTGQTDLAIRVLGSLLDKPGSFNSPARPSYGDLRRNPCWDSLRNDPRFEAIVRNFTRPIPGS